MTETSKIIHELESGDKLIDGEETLIVDYVNEKGVVYCRGGYFTQEEIVTALIDGALETPDGRSHELVKSF